MAKYPSLSVPIGGPLPDFGNAVTSFNPPPIQPIQDVRQTSRIGNLGSMSMDPYSGGVQEPVTMPPDITIGQPPGFDPSTEAIDRFNKLIDAYPEYKSPGMLAKIAASMMALKDPRLAMQLLNNPNEQALERWQSLMGPLQTAAREERYENIEGRKAYEFGREQILKEKKLELQRFRQAHPNFTYKLDEDGYWIASNPQNPAETVNTGIKAHELSEVENAQLQLDVFKEKLEVGEPFKVADDARTRENQAAIARLREELATERGKREQQQLYEELDRRLANQQELKVSPTYAQEFPEAPGAKDESELDRKRRYASNAVELKARNPELGQYVTVNANNDVIVDEVNTGTAVGAFLGGKPNLTKETRDEIIKQVFGTETTPVSRGGNNTPKEGDTKTFPNGTVGKWDGTGWVKQE